MKKKTKQLILTAIKSWSAAEHLWLIFFLLYVFDSNLPTLFWGMAGLCFFDVFLAWLGGKWVAHSEPA